MADYLLGGPKIPYPWEMFPGVMSAIGKLFPSMPSPAPASRGQTVESYEYPFSQLPSESMKLGKNAPPVEKPLIPPPTPGVNWTPPPAVAPTKTALQLAQEDAMKEWEAYQKAISAPGAKIAKVGEPGLSPGFTLGWDFFQKHPEISGGTYTPAGGPPKFLFHENKPQTITDTLMPVIQRYAEQMAKIQAGNMNPEEAGEMFATMPNAEQLGAFATLMGQQTTAGKAPAEIAHLYSQAYRPQIHEVSAGGPGERATLLFPPFGGAPKTVATGAQLEHGAGLSAQVQQIMHDTNLMKANFIKEMLPLDPDYAKDPTKMPPKMQMMLDYFDELGRNRINATQTMLGANRTPGAPAGQGIKMGRDAYMKSIFTKNPNITPQQAEAQYWQDKKAYPNLVE